MKIEYYGDSNNYMTIIDYKLVFTSLLLHLL